MTDARHHGAGRRGRGELRRGPDRRACSARASASRSPATAPRRSTVRRRPSRPGAARRDAARGCRASTCAASCASAARCRSSWSRPRARRSTPSSASRSAPTTTSPSRTGSASWWPACGPCCAGAPSDAGADELGRGDALEVGDVGLDPERHEVARPRRAVALPLKEFELLELLLANAGRVLPRDTLIDRVWGTRLRRRHQDARRPRQAAAGQDRGRPGEPDADRHHPRPRLQVRGPAGLTSVRRPWRCRLRTGSYHGLDVDPPTGLGEPLPVTRGRAGAESAVHFVVALHPSGPDPRPAGGGRRPHRASPWPARCSSISTRSDARGRSPSTWCSRWRRSPWWPRSSARPSTARRRPRLDVIVSRLRPGAPRASFMIDDLDEPRSSSRRRSLMLVWARPTRCRQERHRARPRCATTRSWSRPTPSCRSSPASSGVAAAIPGVILGWLGGADAGSSASPSWCSPWARSWPSRSRRPRWPPSRSERPRRPSCAAGGIFLAASSMGLMRAIVGFLVFLLAFALREQPTWHLGFAVGASVLGSFVGSVAGPPRAPHDPEERILRLDAPGARGGTAGGLVRRPRGRGAGRLRRRLRRQHGQAGVRLDRPARRPRRQPGSVVRQVRDPLPDLWVVGAFIPGGPPHPGPARAS